MHLILLLGHSVRTLEGKSKSSLEDTEDSDGYKQETDTTRAALQEKSSDSYMQEG